MRRVRRVLERSGFSCVESLKAFNQAFDHCPSDGWLSRGEAGLLWRIACSTKGPILEVGTYMGRSTVLLSALGRLIHCVDPFDGFHSDLTGDEIYTRLMKNLNSREITNFIVHRQRIEDFEPVRAGFAYLDGDHTTEGTKAQIRKAIMCGVRVMCLHDYSDSKGGRLIQEAVDNYPGLVIKNKVETMVHCIVEEM